MRSVRLRPTEPNQKRIFLRKYIYFNTGGVAQLRAEMKGEGKKHQKILVLKTGENEGRVVFAFDIRKIVSRWKIEVPENFLYLGTIFRRQNETREELESRLVRADWS